MNNLLPNAAYKVWVVCLIMYLCCLSGQSRLIIPYEMYLWNASVKFSAVMTLKQIVLFCTRVLFGNLTTLCLVSLVQHLRVCIAWVKSHLLVVTCALIQTVFIVLFGKTNLHFKLYLYCRLLDHPFNLFGLDVSFFDIYMFCWIWPLGYATTSMFCFVSWFSFK